MTSALIAGAVNAFLAVMGKLATQQFFEAVLTKVVIYGADKLAAMTTNTVDDEIVADMKNRLAK